MDKLKLAWDTFDFLSEQCLEQETKHSNCTSTLDNFLNQNNSPSKAQRLRLKNKLNVSIESLVTLYKKQTDALDDLIVLYRDIVDIPPEREVDIESLLSLKNVTSTLIHQVNIQKSKFNDLLS